MPAKMPEESFQLLRMPKIAPTEKLYLLFVDLPIEAAQVLPIFAIQLPEQAAVEL